MEVFDGYAGGVFRIHSNIYNRDFLQKLLTALAVNYFPKIGPS